MLRLGTLRIPERFRPGIVLLGKIPDASYEEILSACNGAPPVFATNRELAAWIVKGTPSVAESDVGSIVDSLTSLYRLRTRSERTAAVLARDVAAAAREFDTTVGEKLEERLAALLALDVFNVTYAKAKDLQIDEERTFCDARIITDIRPVFGDMIGSLPNASIIVHTLKIGFHESGVPSHREIFIALDSNDIADLKKVLERAEEKEKRLKSVLDAAKIRLIDLQ